MEGFRDEEGEEEEEVKEVMAKSVVTTMENQVTLREIVRIQHTPHVNIVASLIMSYNFALCSSQRCKKRRLIINNIPKTSR